MRPLSDDALRKLRAARHAIGTGWRLSQSDAARLEADWAPLVEPDRHDSSERFAIARADGSSTQVAGPRWLFHLFGLCHRSVHIGLTAPQGLVLIQRRAPTKDHWPDCWDMAVAGHVPLRDDGSERSYEEGAWKEIEEEIGIAEADAQTVLTREGLTAIGEPFYTFDMVESRNPPFYNAEVHQLFGGTLTAEGMARLRPDFEELSGLYFCPPEEAWGMLERDRIAPGLRFALPRFLDWATRSGRFR